jgi:1-pyrroline-5-carboxylate dehydrogenase
MPAEFKNEPFTDFSDPKNAKAMTDALAKVSSEFGKEYDLIIGGKHKKTQDRIKSINPAQPDMVLGLAGKATSEDADEALKVATETFKTWSMVPPADRAEYLFKAAALMRKRKHEFSAWMVYEASKSWAEADGDTAEAIDFLEFYGREMIRYGGEQPLTKIPTEKNELRYIPLGVGAVIPPWNFPVAIMVGMTSAAFVSGNTVLLKPSSDAPIVAAKFMEILDEVGLPAGVVNYVPGSGAQVGDYIVQHPKTRFIAFTGSMEVGLHINEQAAQPREGQIWIKRTILEMGGKDSIVIDKDCDFDAAVTAVWSSAFGFQGQKCSACSRAIIHTDIYDKFVKKLVEETAKITQGATHTSQDVYMGAVVNESACEKILDYIETGKMEGELLHGGMRAAGDGYFIQPTIFAEVPADARISLEEIFGPVLACIRAKDIDDAFEIANNTEYGLTGSIYSTNREILDRAGNEFHVGNLYYNRKCTGALVGVHPFGGFNMSGTDSKAGGRDYLFLFTQPKTISEQI